MQWMDISFILLCLFYIGILNLQDVLCYNCDSPTYEGKSLSVFEYNYFKDVWSFFETYWKSSKIMIFIYNNNNILPSTIMKVSIGLNFLKRSFDFTRIFLANLLMIMTSTIIMDY